MTLTLLQARTAVLERLDGTVGGFWSDTQLNRWINEGCVDLARRAETNLTSSLTNTITAGTNTVTAPTDTLRIYRVEWDSSSNADVKALEYRDFNNMDEVWWESQESARGEPWCYTTRGSPPSLTLILYPTPSANANLRIHYYAIPATASSDSTVLTIQAGWEDLILDYAEFRALRADADDRWMSAFQMYEGNVSRLMERSRRYVEAAGQIMTPVSGNVPAWLVDAGGWW